MRRDTLTRSYKTGGRKAVQMLLIGLGLGALLWVLNAFMDAFVFGEGTFDQNLVPTDTHDAWHHGIPLVLLVLFGYYAGLVVARRERAEKALARSERRFRSLVQNASDVIAILDSEGIVRYVSPSIERVLGYAPEEYIGRDFFDHMHSGDVWKARNAYAESLRGEELSMEYRMWHADGSWRYFEATGNNLMEDPGIGGVVVNAWDVTESKALKAQMFHQAFHDPLTDLPNRALFLDRLEHALARAERRKNRVAVMFVDLDNFKLVNDSLGHEVGDKLLVAVGERLLASIRPEDTLSHLSGDEFTILLEDTSMSGAIRVSQRVAEKLRVPFDLGDRKMVISASIGIAFGGADHKRAAELIRNADLAMYRAKAKGRNRYEVFEEAMNRLAQERLEMEHGLRQAVEQGEFVVHYQPKVLLQTDEVFGFEALVRWKHPERGLVPPLEFVSVAEETGLIIPLGRWVLGEACRQVKEWNERYSTGRTPTVSVNLSPRQFRQPNLAESIAETLRETRLDPHYLELEVTESSAMENAKAADASLRKLKSLGVRIVVDDFGTGYSSLSRLKHLPVDAAKIDRSFVRGLGEDREDEVLVAGMIRMTTGLGLDVVAEGVETGEQAARLRELGCAQAQGFHFFKPLPSAEASALLTRNPPQQLA